MVSAVQITKKPSEFLNARRLFKKYDKLMFNPDAWKDDGLAQASIYAKQLFDELIDEAYAKTVARKSETYADLYNVLLEQDQKWKDLIARAIRKYEWCPLKTDTVMKLSKTVVPQLKMVEKGDFRSNGQE